MIGSMFQLTNAKGETVDIQTNSLRAYTPTGLGTQYNNTYTPFGATFIRTSHLPIDPTSLPVQFYLQFGDVSSQSYQTFSDFASFLAYEPLTLSYTTDSGTWYRDCNVESLTKTEIGGSSIIAADRLNEIIIFEFINPWYNNLSAVYQGYSDDPNLGTYGKIYGGTQGVYVYNPYYVYIESGRNLNQKSMLVSNDSEYNGLQSGSPALIEIDGPCTINPSWKVVQDGITVASDGFLLTLSSNQRLLISSYPNDQYARIYNPDNSYSDVSQYQDFTKTNYVLIPEGDSTIVFYVDQTAGVQFTFKEERMLV
ncbi:phage distal tail protein domain-containing protein [Oenococcus oeni]|uniref:phage distal tail protein domain-containing protein n=1 Tax=Oenococcus oeni TaxID=1247 RepID=UPI000AA8F0DE|nr:phage distal tail protein domain-containing protein [Oenococcus oeni]